MLHGGDRHAAIDVGALVFGPQRGDPRRLRGRDRALRPGRSGDPRRGRRARRGAALASRRSSRCCGSSGWDASTLHDVLGPLLDQAGGRRPGHAGGPPLRAVRDLRPPLRRARRPRPAVRDRPAALRAAGLRGRDRVLRGLARAARPRPGDGEEHRALRGRAGVNISHATDAALTSRVLGSRSCPRSPRTTAPRSSSRTGARARRSFLCHGWPLNADSWEAQALFLATQRLPRHRPRPPRPRPVEPDLGRQRDGHLRRRPRGADRAPRRPRT